MKPFAASLAVAICTTLGLPGVALDKRLFFQDRTYVTFEATHGFQILHIETARRSWLWYPGNRVSLRATRRTKKGQVCFRYGATARNPARPGRNAVPECTLLSLMGYLTIGEAEEDVFGLAAGAVPHVRGKCDCTGVFAHLRPDADLLRIGCGKN